MSLTLAVGLTAASVSATELVVDVHPRWELVWADEFEGDQLDAAKWNIQVGDGSHEGIPGWGNNELQRYETANVAVRDGHLIITALAEAGGAPKYTSARINTDGKFAVRYGRVEGRIRTAPGQGLWAAFWMLPSNSPYGAWPASGEIDIMEAFARRPAPFIQGVVHYGMAWPLNVYTAKRYESVDPADDFHEYALEWDAKQLRWFVDGVHFHTVPNTTYWTCYKDDATNAHQRGPESAPFDQPFHLLLNLAVGGDLPGEPVAAAFPGELRVDYVRVHRCAPGAETGLGCAGLAAPLNPAVRPTAPERGHEAAYDLCGDAVGRCSAPSAATVPPGRPWASGTASRPVRTAPCIARRAKLVFGRRVARHEALESLEETAMDGTKTHEEMRTELLGKVAEDDAFRARLIEEPKAAIKEALDVELPDTVAVRVLEDSASTVHLVLPPSADLSDQDLEAIAAGHSYNWNMYRTRVGEHRHYEGGPLHGGSIPD